MKLCKALLKPGILWMANSLTNDNSFTIHSFHWLMCPINNPSFVSYPMLDTEDTKMNKTQSLPSRCSSLVGEKIDNSKI